MKRLFLLLLLAGIPLISEVTAALADLLLNAGNEEEVARLLDQSPAAVDQALFAVCRKSAQGRLDHRQHPDALREFRATLAVAQRLKSPPALASAYRGLGLSYWRLDQGKEALANYEKGLTQATLANDRPMMAELLRGIGVAHRGTGEPAAAIEADEKSIALYRELHNEHFIGAGLNNLAGNYFKMGELRRAAEYYEEAARVAKAFPDVVDSANGNLGAIAATEGDFSAAKNYLEQSLQYNEQIKDSRGIAIALTNLGPIYHQSGQFAMAISVYDRAIILAKSINDIRTQAVALLNRASVQISRKRPDLAIVDLKESLHIQEQGQSYFGLSVVLSNLAVLESAAGNTDEAFAEVERATAIGHQFGSPELLWQSMNATALCELKRNRREEARKAFEAAIENIESWRMRIGAGEPEGQRFLEDKIAPYHGLLRLLLEDGHSEAALAVAEKAKARQLLDALRSGQAQVTGVLTAKERLEEQRLTANAGDLNRRLADTRDPSLQASIRASWEEAANGLQAFRTRLYAAHPELAAKRGDADPITLAQATELLPDRGVALIEFTVSEDNIYVFTITRGASGRPELATRTLRWNRTELTREVNEFQQQLASRDLSYRKTAEDLYRRLLGPLDQTLKTKTTLVVAPDGPLWNLPFQALLLADGRHLLERQAVFYAPSLTFLREHQRQSHSDAGGQQLLAVTSAQQADLPYAAREVRELTTLYDSANTLTISGGSGVKDTWKAEAPRYRVLHFATHGMLNSENPMYSYLQLGGGNILEAREIVNMDLHAEMAVLSACETARGQARYGEGLVGMSWAFLTAGTSTTVVSQWKVDSASTAMLMLTFHRLLKPVLDSGSRVGRARSLQQAALGVMHTPEHQHPFYWAGFVLVGNGY